jgi:hypothetical protein
MREVTGDYVRVRTDVDSAVHTGDNLPHDALVVDEATVHALTDEGDVDDVCSVLEAMSGRMTRLFGPHYQVHVFQGERRTLVVIRREDGAYLFEHLQVNGRSEKEIVGDISKMIDTATQTEDRHMKEALNQMRMEVKTVTVEQAREEYGG